MKRKWMPGLFDFLNFRVEHPKLKRMLFYPPGMRRGMKALALLHRFANLPIIQRFHPWGITEKTKLFILPVDKTFEREPEVVLPYQLVERYIEQSSYRVIMDFCACRTAGECKDYPTDLGCILMGEDVRKIPSAWTRMATKEEAKKHLYKGIAAGLPCFVGKPRIDNFIFGIPDHGHMLSVCFCCDCCCLGKELFKHLPLEKRKVQFNRLSGLHLWVEEEKCDGCGRCLEKCVVNAIAISDGKAAVHGECMGCGRCAKFCPRHAIHLRLENPDYLNQAMNSLKSVIEL